MNRVLKLALGLAAAAALAGRAQAATWVLDYTATNGGAPTEASLTLETAGALDAAGGYDVTSITGEVDGETITGLIANPDQPFASYSSDGMFIFDNVFYADSSPVLSNPGLFFSGASGDEYNLFSDNATQYELYKATSGVGYQANSVGVLAYRDPPSIPEPATWMMMILGFGSIGALLRRRRNAVASALA
jgi:PEP-CTERM motif